MLVHPTDRVLSEGAALAGVLREGFSGVAVDWFSEAGVMRRWRHRSSMNADEEAGEPLLELTTALASWSPTRLSRWTERLIETRTYGPTVVQEMLVNGFHPVERLVPFGDPGDLEGWCIWRFGAACAVSFGLGGATDSVLDVSSREGSGLSGGDVREA